MATQINPWRYEGRGLRLAAGLLTLAAFFAAAAAPGVELDYARDKDPQFDPFETVVPKFAPRLKPLWLEALAHKEGDLKRQAAAAIGRAHRMGMPGLAEEAPRLLEELEAPDADPIVRLASARALIDLDARHMAPALMRHAQADGFDTARLVEPALLRWDHAPMRDVWLARLADPQKSPRGLLTLAARAAAVLKLSDAVPDLRRLALDPQAAADVRLEAARSLALLQTADLEGVAGLLAKNDSPPFERLVAATLLAHHRGPAAEALMFQLADVREPAVAAVAVKRLLEIDPVLVKPLLEKLVKSPDSGLRQLAARALAELRTPETVALLGPLLDDPHVGVRVSVREYLILLDGVEPLKGPVRRAVMQVLARGARPRGLEQAAMVVGAIRYEPAAGRLVQLLDNSNMQVKVPAAWALRRLAVLETADPILKRVQSTIAYLLHTMSQDPSTFKGPPPLTSTQLEHLLEALGMMRYVPAAPLLKNFLPVPPPPAPGPRSPYYDDDLRAAALWSLGYIYAADPPPKDLTDLAALFRVRLINAMEPPKESETARAIMAVNLGRMKIKDAVPKLQEYYQSEPTALVVRRASAWALEQITGKPLPPLPPVIREVYQQNWFLEPLGR